MRIPATANARTLLRITAGYIAQSTPVNLAVGLLREDGQASLARKVDNHGQGAPKPVEIILPFSEPNARLLLLLADEPAVPSRPQFDARSPYSVKVEVLDNPDTNEPNDAPGQATALNLQAQGAVQVATTSGYLATTNDVDRFSFNVPANKVAYVRLFAEQLNPPPSYRLSYTLVRPDGTAEAEGRVANAFVAADLATARRVKTGGTWTVVVQGYKPAGDTNPVPGDLRQRYNLEVRVMDEQDAQDLNGDNDVIGRALVRTIGSGPGSSTSFPGRIGSVPDADWYGVDVPALVAALGAHLPAGAERGRWPLPAAARAGGSPGARALAGDEGRGGAGLEGGLRDGRDGLPQGLRRGPLRAAAGGGALQREPAAVPPRHARGGAAELPQPAQLRGRPRGAAAHGHAPLLLRRPGRREQLGGRQGLQPSGVLAG